MFRQSWSRSIRFAGALVAFGATFYEPILTEGPSMFPTIRSLDVIVLDHTATVKNGRIRRGDVVAAYSPQSLDPVCKRICGLPGDVIRANPFDPDQEPLFVKIPPGHVWLAGDNPACSTDSRVYGPVPQALISGKAIGVIWPTPQTIPARSLDPYFS